MKRKGYSCIEDFRGTLKARDKDTKITKEPVEQSGGSSSMPVPSQLMVMQAAVGVLLAIIAALVSFMNSSCTCMTDRQ